MNPCWSNPAHVRALADRFECDHLALLARIKLCSVIRHCTDALQRELHITRAEARRRYDATAPAMVQYQADLILHIRRQQTKKAPYKRPVAARIMHMLEKLLGARPAGAEYSGSTTWTIKRCEPGYAHCYTSTDFGDRYSKSSRFRKTNGFHIIYASLLDVVRARKAGLPAKLDGMPVLAATQVCEGVYTVSLAATIGKHAKMIVKRATRTCTGTWRLSDQAHQKTGRADINEEPKRTAEGQP